MSVLITTEILGNHPILTSADTNLDLVSAWVRSGDGLIGFGEYKRFEVKGEDRFIKAKNWWSEQLSEFSIQNNVHGSGTGPILFSSFSFDSNDTSVLIIPEVVLGHKNGKSWITWIGNKGQPEITQISTSAISSEITWQNGSISDERWREQVTAAIAAIKNSQLEKVVLARDLTATANTSIDIRNLLQRLEIEYPSTWLFFVDGLIGATPELLVRLSKSLVTSRVLAGTIRKSGNEDRDLALAASLAKSSKDLEEHEYAVKSVADALAPFCSSTNVPESPFVLHLANVMHLATDVTGALVETLAHIDAFTILEQLHPTAAVCGTPRPIATALINEIEGMSRGRYAGPVGWIDAAGDGELGIALRCGQINGDSIRIFAGCGIVDGSDPEIELAETYAKFSPMRSALK